MASSEIEVTESPPAAVDVFSTSAYGDLEQLRRFVEQGGASLSVPDANGYYALQWAALNNFADVVQYIIENGGNVNATDNLKQTALHWAAVRGSVAVADVLLQNGAWEEAADVNGSARDFRIIASNVICSIGIVYNNDRSIVRCSQHGRDRPQDTLVAFHDVLSFSWHGSFSTKTEALLLASYISNPRKTCFSLLFLRVGLDDPEERLVVISGWMNRNGNAPQTITQNLKIHTTETTHGPFGSEDALGRLTEFRIPPVSGGGKIVPFQKGGIIS